MSRCTGGLGLPCGCDLCRVEPRVARSADLYGLITVSENGGNMLAPPGRGSTIPPPFNEDAERVAFCDWYRNSFGVPAISAHGGWVQSASIAWSAWLARAKV